MTIEHISNNDEEHINVFVDKSASNGLLNFSHEIAVTFIRRKNELIFESAWHCGVSEMEWNSSEEKSFEETFPGLLTEIRKEIINAK